MNTGVRSTSSTEAEPRSSIRLPAHKLLGATVGARIDGQVKPWDEGDADGPSLDTSVLRVAFGEDLPLLEQGFARLVEQAVSPVDACLGGASNHPGRPGTVLSRSRRQFVGVVPQGELEDDHEQQQQHREDQYCFESRDPALGSRGEPSPRPTRSRRRSTTRRSPVQLVGMLLALLITLAISLKHP